MNELPPKWRQFYDRTAPALAIICLLAAFMASVGVFWQDRVNDRQDDQRNAEVAERAADNTRLLNCFDDFATALAGGLPPVRVASAKRDDALGHALGDLERLLVKALSQNADPSDGEALVASLSAYREANRDLREVREANPYPEAPSTFCKPAS